jgi:FkbM family methyltransferase
VTIVSYGGLKFNTRTGTTDYDIIKEACGGLYTKYFDVEEGEVWFDFGAHIGAFTCYAASKGAVVISFEPLPENYTILNENIVLNDLGSLVQPYNKAVAKDDGEIDFYVDTQNYGNCSMYERPLAWNKTKVHTIPVKEVATISNYCAKVDTEGREYDIISGLNLTKCNKLVFEFHYWLYPSAEEELEELNTLLNNNFNHIEEHGGYMYYAWKEN